MYGVVGISKHRPRSTLSVYSDLPSAISYFFELNNSEIAKGGDISVQANMNNDCALLSSQNILYNISDLEKYNLPGTAILNIGIHRNKKYECRLFSALIVLSKELIQTLSNHYEINEIFIQNKTCDLCKSTFKVWDEAKNCGYQGCIYNPLYYEIITIENLESYHAFGVDIQPELNKLSFDKSQIFFMRMDGSLNGLLLSKIPLPKDWYHGMIFCWNCMDNMEDKFQSIWSH